MQSDLTKLSDEEISERIAQIEGGGTGLESMSDSDLEARIAELEKNAGSIRSASTRKATFLERAANLGKGAAYALGDIGGGVAQLAERYLPLPEKAEQFIRDRNRSYLANRAKDLSRPGGLAGYVGGNVGLGFAPGLGAAKIAQGAGRLAKLGSAVGKPAATSAGLTAVKPYESEGERFKEAATSAGLTAGFGSALPAVRGIKRAAGKGARGALLGGEVFEATGEQAKLAAWGKRQGFRFTPGEVMQNKRLQGLETGSETMLGGGYLAKVRGRNLDLAATHLSRMVGKPTKELTPEWVDSTKKALGKRFDALRTSGGTIELGGDFIAKASKAIPPKIDEAGQREIGGILDRISRYGGRISKADYLDIKSFLSEQSHLTPSGAMSRSYAIIGEALDEVVSKSLGPTERRKFDVLREQFKRFKVIESSLEKTGSGNIRYGALLNNTLRSYPQATATSLGKNKLLDLARTLNTFKNQIGSSGTAERLQGQELVRGLSRMVGGGAGFAVGGIPGAVAGAAAPASVQRLLMSEPFERFVRGAPRTRAGAPKAGTAGRKATIGAGIGITEFEEITPDRAATMVDGMTEKQWDALDEKTQRKIFEALGGR